MNGNWMPFCLAVLLVIGFPRLAFGIWSLSQKEESRPNEYTEASDAVSIKTIQVLTDEGLKDMDLEEYFVGVLLLEIPGNFHLEAQKAQAVVARTYALRTTQFKEKHENSAICTDPGCCQGYRDPEEYLLAGGSEERVALAKKAVDETKGWILIYDGMPIDATYFSCSGGKTEDALAVWGVDIPYLQSVSSPGEEDAVHNYDTVEFTLESFQEALGQTLWGKPNRWFGQATYTRGGGVESMIIGGKLYSGTTLRTLLGLRSTAFSVSVSKNTIIITTRGYGHRVGMSQYGAQAMALSGNRYADILAHYYPGTVIDKVDFIG